MSIIIDNKLELKNVFIKLENCVYCDLLLYGLQWVI